MLVEPEPVGHTPRQQGLRRNYLSGFELTFQSVGTVAPSASMSLLISVIFAASGMGSWIALLFAGAGTFLLALQLSVFGRRIASPGALFAYVHAGLGPLFGVIAGWSVLLAYVLFIATIPPQIANLISGLLQDHLGSAAGSVTRLGVMAASLLLPWYLAQRDIKLSTRITSVIEIATMLLVLFLIAAYFRHRDTVIDPAQFDLHAFTFGQLHLGLVLAFLCYGGFETAMELGAEARRPFIVIPRILVTVVVLLTIFFVIAAYGTIAAFQGITPSLDQQNSPMVTLAHSLDHDGVGALIEGGILCSLLASLLGCINAAGRVLYAFSHRGLVFRAMGATHPVHSTPYRAIGAVTLIGGGIALSLTLARIPPLAQLSYIGTISSLSILVSYMLVAIAAPFYLAKLGTLKAGNVVSAVLTVCFIAVPLAGSLYPVPDYPLNILPYIFLGLMALGTGYFLVIRRIDPQRLESSETEFLAAPKS